MPTYECFTCPEDAVGVIPRDHSDERIRRLPVCQQHARELISPDADGFRYVQMFGAVHPSYLKDS